LAALMIDLTWAMRWMASSVGFHSLGSLVRLSTSVM
jgi:hypothetical protein